MLPNKILNVIKGGGVPEKYIKGDDHIGWAVYKRGFKPSANYVLSSNLESNITSWRGVLISLRVNAEF